MHRAMCANPCANLRAMPVMATLRAIALIALLTTQMLSWAQTKPRIDKAADLPRFSYRIEGKVEDVVRNADRFAPFAAALRKDIESVLGGYEIGDKATQRDLMTTLALLDFLDGKYDQALARAEQVRDLQDKPADKLISGLRLRAVSAAARSNAPGSDAHRQQVAELINKELAAAPFAVIENEVREIKAGAELIGEALILGRVREVMQPIVTSSGALSSEFAPGVVGARYSLLVTLPLKQTFIDTFSSYLAAHKVTKADIWAARDVTLGAKQRGNQRGKQVNVAIWDSGVDTRLFPGRVLKDKRAPQVIAFDKYSRRSSGELMPVPTALRARLPELKARTKGLSDLESNIDSPEASEVKRFLSQLTPDKYKAAVEELNLVGSYVHGTHVAGITMAGNPFARLMVARIEFGHTIKPEPCPSRELSLRDAAAAQAYVDFFKARRARVVNMSWGGNVTSIEGELEQCGVGKTPEERKALAREYFDISKNALTKAMASAPGILFVAAAGNSGDDASFTESIPAGIELPNLLTVGAVDLAGDEASFTSYGPTVKVHANGYQVQSLLPGGDKVALSGTSMSSPQVANLAAKMLALNPKLDPPTLVKIIVDTADKTSDGRRNLMNPKKAIAAATR